MHHFDAKALTRPPFAASDFTPTGHADGEAKSKFANNLSRFISTDFRSTLFTKSLYTRLSMCFGHIAHYNRGQFYAGFFTDLRGKVAFLEQTLAWPCYGMPDYTFCDVERAIQTRLRRSEVLPYYRHLHAAEVESAERALLCELRAKYEGVLVSEALHTPEPRPAAASRCRSTETREEQSSLF